jgi:hypothetical protein
MTFTNERIGAVVRRLVACERYRFGRPAASTLRIEVTETLAHDPNSAPETTLAVMHALQVDAFHAAVGSCTPADATPLSRLTAFFTLATRALAERPQLAQAIVRLLAAGEPEQTARVASYYDANGAAIVVLRRGSTDDTIPTDSEVRFSRLLHDAWFGALAGYTAGVHGPDEVIRRTVFMAELLLHDTAST